MSGRNLLLYVLTKRAIKLTAIIIVGYHCYQTQYEHFTEYPPLFAAVLRSLQKQRPLQQR
jgi:hypothetical protein